jgi:long-chain acyl-CoA synthetase
VVPTSVRLLPREIAYHLRDSDAKALLCFEGTAERPMAEAAKAAVAVVPTCEQLIVMTRDGSDAFANDPDVSTLAQLTAGHPGAFDTVATSPEDTAVILYTSGTTGQPKGAELTHLNMVMNAMVAADLCVAGHDEHGNYSSAVTLPLFHATAQTVQMNAYLYLGCRASIPPRCCPR